LCQKVQRGDQRMHPLVRMQLTGVEDPHRHRLPGKSCAQGKPVDGDPLVDYPTGGNRHAGFDQIPFQQLADAGCVGKPKSTCGGWTANGLVQEPSGKSFRMQGKACRKISRRMFIVEGIHDRQPRLFGCTCWRGSQSQETPDKHHIEQGLPQYSLGDRGIDRRCT